ncbi:polysaccharide deacetylase family protein [Aquirufa rosea]|uniref:Polysaccharide deacetylase n=1 Tax=Aquirufa rosea TaxID=2509241 RepID=A0A4Q1BZM9_9BACT|nr:polysaccharide deacetylase family protein [Aquirufa rosea]RXK48949.1 polysaccharide deacetylase [Aquirufa rosea]
MKKLAIFLCGLALLGAIPSFSQQFTWPSDKKMALSLSFDDARGSQVTLGTKLLNQYGVKATFFVNPGSMEKNLTGWKKAVADGHEIGNHSTSHPCTGIFTWSRANALENYSLEKMEKDILDCNASIEKNLGVKAEVFAYPCGQTFIGNATQTQSYVPLIAKHFLLGRLWKSEAPNDPNYHNFAQLTGIEMDGQDFEQILPLIEEARKTGKWLVLAGHEMNESGNQTTRLSMLKKLMEYATNPANGIWIAPMGTVAKYIQSR